VATSAVVTLGLASAGGAFADFGLSGFTGLPSNPIAQINNDAANGDGIDPMQNVDSSDTVAGTLIAGKIPVPWTAFSQHESNGSEQIFVRAFKGGVWQTEGAPLSPGTFASLNFAQNARATNPGIDFAGAGRLVPWVAWDETSAAGPTQIFASRFIPSTGAANGGVWNIDGQNRGAVGPSLNIHANQPAENPAVAGGSTAVGGNPAPWVVWEETDSSAFASPSRQIFVSKGILNPAGSQQPCPAGTKPSAATSVGAFCFQQTGVDRTGVLPTDPSLNIDQSRDGIEPDITFTGPSDTVPWVVWYETGTSQIAGRANNDLIFAAKGINPTAAMGTVDGSIQWEAVGGNTTAATPLDASAGGGGCFASLSAEQACSLNHNPTLSAQDPKVAVGTMAAGTNTVPWVVWTEQLPGSGNEGIFVAKLDTAGTPAGVHFDILNNGNPVSNPANDATTPDIVFDGNIPYVTWTEQEGTAVGSPSKLFVGHFEPPAANPTFVLDTPVGPGSTGGISVTPQGLQNGARSPIASSCAPNSVDVDACPSGAIGTPFFTFVDGPNSLQELFGGAYLPTSVLSGPTAATGITATTATVTGGVTPGGAATALVTQFGTDKSYTLGTSAPIAVPSSAAGDTSLDTADTVSAALTGLPASTIIHYRTVALTDFGPVDGPDATFTTAAGPTPTPTPTPVPTPIPTPAKTSLASASSTVSGGVAAVRIRCTGGSAGQVCSGELALVRIVHRVVHVRVGRHHKTIHKTITTRIGTASLSLPTGTTATVSFPLNAAGLNLLSAHHGNLTVTLESIGAGAPVRIGTVTLHTVRGHGKGKHHH
jgi:hypothetical protein